MPAIAIAVFVSPLWRWLGTWGGTFDWGYFFFLAEVDRVTVTQYGQFPLWNPYYCGGAVHLANPQTYFLSPTFLLILLFGTPIGLRLTLTAAIVMAYDGTRRFCRALGLSQGGASVAGLGYAMCGTIAQHLGGGHVGWLGFCVLPYVLHSFHRALGGERRHLLVGALFLAWIFCHFGGYTFPYSCLFLAVYGFLTGIATRRVRPAITTVASIAGGALALSSLRLLPILDFVKDHPRFTADTDVVHLKELAEIYLWRHRERSVPGHGYVWPEYGNYVGAAGVALATLGVLIVVRERRRLWPLVACVGVFLLYQLGNVPGLPWSLTKHLPIFRYMRVPSRFTILVGLMLCVLSGLAVTRAFRRTGVRPGHAGRGGRVLRASVVALAGLFIADIVQFNREQWFQTMTAPAPHDRVLASFKQMRGEKARMYAYPRSNQGSLACFEESPLDISPLLKPDLPADEYPDDRSAGTVRRVSWSPNRIVLDATFTKPGRIVVNQNWNPHWHVQGGRLENHRGLLAVAVDSGRNQITLRYLPMPFLIGLGMTLATLALGVGLWWRWRPQSGGDPRPLARWF